MNKLGKIFNRGKEILVQVQLPNFVQICPVICALLDDVFLQQTAAQKPQSEYVVTRDEIRNTLLHNKYQPIITIYRYKT